MNAPKIKKLSQEVINKIAAGEIVQRPFSVVKEMTENSIDAGSTSIIINLLSGGLQQIKIADNGSGIMKEDFPLLCERFATSKINSVQDLTNLTSFGFRGEALASISFVSKLTVISKQPDKEIGFTATYQNCQICENKIMPIGCEDGQIITIVSKIFQELQCKQIIYFLIWNIVGIPLTRMMKKKVYQK